MSRFLPDRTTSGAALSGLLLALSFPSNGNLKQHIRSNLPARTEYRG